MDRDYSSPSVSDYLNDDDEDFEDERELENFRRNQEKQKLQQRRKRSARG